MINYYKHTFTLLRLLIVAGLTSFASNASAQTSPACSTAVNIPVKSNSNDCFTNYTHVVTMDVGTAFTPTGTCSTADDNAWWGTFTATSTTTNFFMWEKDKDYANFIVYSGTCSALTQVLCIQTQTDSDPMSGTLATVPGQTYYILIHHKMTEARLCVYSETPEATKPVCTAGMSFEDGTGAGWNSKYGVYRLVTAPGITFMYDIIAGTRAGRFQLTSGTGGDPKLGAMVPVVAPGGGTHSYRIGYNGGSSTAFSDIIPSPTGYMQWQNHSAVSQMSYCFTVDPTNAGFGYKYATIMDAPFHDAVLQPQFDVFLTLAATGDTIPCGNHSHYPGDGKSPFHYVGQNTDVSINSGICYTPWTDVLTDLTGYAGQQVCATFRVRNCEGGGQVACCPYDTGLVGGSHGAYAYFDTYCIPMAITIPEFCAGTASIQICAPPGYQTYSWPAGQPGISGSPTTQCVTVNNPTAGTTYTVNMMSYTGCPTSAKAVIKNIPLIKTADTTLCSNNLGSLPLTVSISNPVDPPYTYAWSTGQTGTAITVNPTTSTNYVVTVKNGSGCISTDTIKVIVKTCSTQPKAIFISSDTIFCNESGQCIDFFDHSIGNPTSWKWTFTGASPDTSTTQNPTGICYYVPGSYTVKLVIQTPGGPDSMTVSPLIIFATGATAPTLWISNDTLFSSHAAAYQWYYNGSVIPGATDSFYVATQPGTYNVYITDDNGCSRLGNSIFYTGINDNPGHSEFVVFPNPTGNEFTVYGLRLMVGSTIELYNVLGEKVYYGKTEDPNDNQAIVNVSTLAKGVYILELRSNSKSYRVKVVKD